MTLCSITGTLAWPDGEPAPGEVVRIFARDIRASGDGAVMPSATYAVTDGSGSFSLDLVPGSYRLLWRDVDASISVPDAPSASLQKIMRG